MKILLVHQYFLGKNQGGGARFNEMTKIWADKGHTVTVIAGMHELNQDDIDKYQGKNFYHENDFYKNTDVHRCRLPKDSNQNFKRRIIAYFSFVLKSTWVGLFKLKGKYDVIIVTSPPLFLGITAYILSTFKRIPLIFEVRDLWPESAIDTGVISNPLLIKFSFWFEKSIYKKAKLINVLTPAFKEKLIKKGIPEEKIIYIPNAADFSLAEKVAKDFDPEKFRKSEGIQDKFVITYIGAHGIANHLIQIIEAAEKLQNTNVLFQLIGDGMTKPDLIRETDSRGLKNIRFVGFVDKETAFKYILASDVGASVLKKVDTFKTIYSNKTFDYMSCKKPILLAIDGISRQLIEDANCGVYVEPENSDDIAEKVRKFIKGEYNIKEQGENGYKYAKSRFDRTELAQQYLSEIINLAKKN
ncbi:glycosyltransferase family 4 protein [Maribacter cobaltidurans]|uniref:Glycosyltransferase WbuB n=1 Tax=Maribacter cobaltidurans TaxID=1178778 RepID=A0A223V1A4_9FLAO|nr:glycosyltransferase family 4 protein [Maribacter cobaltidurans]ASV28848.1 glycosyltransferase WbuB [Maribacter cobaltidurans]GGD74317.1 glycosyltransferase WbuB [Maribacter cobaltidurans]